MASHLVVCSGPVSRIKCKGNTWRGYGCDFIDFAWFWEEFALDVMAACNKSQIYTHLKHILCDSRAKVVLHDMVNESLYWIRQGWFVKDVIHSFMKNDCWLNASCYTGKTDQGEIMCLDTGTGEWFWWQNNDVMWKGQGCKSQRRAGEEDRRENRTTSD